MLYHFDPADINCDAFRAARERADLLYSKWKKFYLGSRDDLRQSALLAVWEWGRKQPDPKYLPEKPLLEAITEALRRECNQNPKSPQWPLTKPAPDSEPVPVDFEQPDRTPDPVPDALLQLRGRVNRLLEEREAFVLWRHHALGESIEACYRHWAERLGPRQRKKWTLEECRRIAAESLEAVRNRLDPELSRALQKLLKPADPAPAAVEPTP